MPILPDISATIDTTLFFKKERVKTYYSLMGWGSSSNSVGRYAGFWPVSLQWGTRPAGRNYYALEMHEEKTLIEGTQNPWNPNTDGKRNLGIFVSELSKLQDNPEVEINETQEINLDPASKNYELYMFQIMLMSDIAFTNDNASLALFKEWVYIRNRNSLLYPPTVVYKHTVNLRVRHITEATFRYYRSLALQSGGIGFFTEPVNIIGNIENGYGGFMVYSAVDIQLLEYETYEYRGGYW